MLGYKDRGAVLAAEHSQKIIPSGNGMLQPTIVMNGQVVGTWKRALKKTDIAMEYTLFNKAAQSTVFETAVGRSKRFLFS